MQVRAAFAMSYRHLGDEAAALFRRLSVVPGADTGVELAAVAADQPAEVAERVLEDLVDASRLTASPDQHACHDLLRVFAAERLEQDEGVAEADRRREATGRWLLTTATLAALCGPASSTGTSARVAQLSRLTIESPPAGGLLS